MRQSSAPEGSITPHPVENAESPPSRHFCTQSTSGPSGTSRRVWLAHHGSCRQLGLPGAQRQAAPSTVTAQPAEHCPFCAHTSRQGSAVQTPPSQCSSTGSLAPAAFRPHAGVSPSHTSPGVGNPSGHAGAVTSASSERSVGLSASCGWTLQLALSPTRQARCKNSLARFLLRRRVWRRSSGSRSPPSSGRTERARAPGARPPGSSSRPPRWRRTAESPQATGGITRSRDRQDRPSYRRSKGGRCMRESPKRVLHEEACCPAWRGVRRDLKPVRARRAQQRCLDALQSGRSPRRSPQMRTIHMGDKAHGSISGGISSVPWTKGACYHCAP